MSNDNEMLVTSRGRVQKLFDEGQSEQRVLAEKPLADLDKKWAANDQQAQNWLVAAVHS